MENKVKLSTPIDLDKTTFINEEVFNVVNFDYQCSNCDTKIHVQIIAFVTGKPLTELANRGFSEKDILKHQLANLTTENYKHLGKFTIENLPTFYIIEICPECKAEYLITFAIGEKQASLFKCIISGIWRIENN